jgi:hypothetical protein
MQLYNVLVQGYGFCLHTTIVTWLLTVRRLMGALGRTLVVAYVISWLMFLLLIMLCGFVLAKGELLRGFALTRLMYAW